MKENTLYVIGGIYMKYRLIIDGNSVYEIDEECESEQSSKGTEKAKMKNESDKGG